MLKTIIFDIGNVIQPSMWDHSAGIVGVPVEKWQKAFKHDRENNLDQIEIGAKDDMEFVKFLADNLNITEIEKIRDAISLFGPPDNRLIELIKLIDPVINLGILSNNWKLLEEGIRKYDDTEHEYFSLFEPHVYLSHNIGLKKPSPKAFNYVLDKMNAKPETTLFVDDQENNIQAAESLGIQSFLYKDFEEFKEFISDYLINADSRSRRE